MQGNIFPSIGYVGIGTKTPCTKLQICGGADAKLSGGGYLVAGALKSRNIVMDDNEIMARNRGKKSTLLFQKEGGDLAVHRTRFVIKDSGKIGIGTTKPLTKLHITGGEDVKLRGHNGYLMIGTAGSWNIVMDDNEIMARNRGKKSALHFQGEGGDLIVHYHQPQSRFIVKDSGNVGIGTGRDDPLSRLHVKASGFEWDDHLILEGSTGNKWQFLVDSGAENKLRVSNRNRGIEAITVQTDGKVGIGTTSPTAKLEVRGDLVVKNGSLLIRGNKLEVEGTIHSTQGGFKFPDGILQITAATGGATGGLWAQSGNDIYNKTGRVGIGTPNPQATLDVNGNVRIAGSLTTGDEMCTSLLETERIECEEAANFRGQVCIGDARASLAIKQFKSWADYREDWSALKIKSPDDQYWMDIQTYKVPTDIQSGLQATGEICYLFRTKNPYRVDTYNALVFDSFGNVGIGTKLPKEKLTVEGNIHAAGRIFAAGLDVNKNVVVRGVLKIKNWELSVPDAVFKEDYKLMKLNDLEQYVSENHHLPEIPSGEEMKKEGLNLNEFCMSLLKKVEELSLYVIKQDKQINELKAKLAFS